ncbi:MAG: hypothetical protein GY821_08025, partial [Gammaproteobacteria bacterium]|nr:hypothetical protein [Gammaproteobacteria bacterium]
MKYRASKWMYPITLGNAMLGIVLGSLFIMSPKIHILAAIATLTYGFISLWGTIVFTKYPVYAVNGSILEITRMFKKNNIIDVSEIDKTEEVKNSYLYLYNGNKVVNGVSSAQIGSKQFIDLVATIRQVITNHS